MNFQPILDGDYLSIDIGESFQLYHLDNAKLVRATYNRNRPACQVEFNLEMSNDLKINLNIAYRKDEEVRVIQDRIRQLVLKLRQRS